jgi:hypothetical protein
MRPDWVYRPRTFQRGSPQRVVKLADLIISKWIQMTARHRPRSAHAVAPAGSVQASQHRACSCRRAPVATAALHNAAAGIAKVLFFIFTIIFLVLLVLGLVLDSATF